MEIQTLSSFPGVPFNDSIEEFFNAYKLDEDIEFYQFVFCPYGRKTSFDDLYKIKFKSRVVILNVIDSIIDKYDNIAIKELTQFCEDHPEQKFIIFSFHLNFQNELKDIPNLYHDTIFSANTSEVLNRCEKKDISNEWICLNRNIKLHKVLTVCHLLSKDYYLNGHITLTENTPILSRYHQYKNISEIPVELKKSFSKGFARLKAKEFNLSGVHNFDKEDDRVANNYNTNLVPAYENVAVEIITGTMFFEKTPLLSEKEMQSVYAKNFPIYINVPGMVKEIKNLFDLDLFEDIIDHSYDKIENHFERLAAAIDRNQHLLDGSTNIKELWYDNQERFEENCDKIDAALHDKSYQRMFNHERIKKALTHFNITFVKN